MPFKMSDSELPIYYLDDVFTFFLLLFFSLFETRCQYVAQDDLVLIILLPQLPKCWGYRCVPPCLALAMLFFLCPNSRFYRNTDQYF